MGGNGVSSMNLMGGIVVPGAPEEKELSIEQRIAKLKVFVR